MGASKHQKPKAIFLLFLALAMGFVDAFLRWQRNYQSPSSVMSCYLSLWQPDQTAKTDNFATLIDQLDSQYPATRWAAAANLSQSGCQQAVPFLIQAMDDDRGTVRTCVMAQSLGALADDRAVPALVKALNHASNEDLRICASKALGRIGDTRSIEPLIEAFQSDLVGFSALQALGRIGSPPAESYLRSIVQNSSRSSEVSMARDALDYIDIGKKRNDNPRLQALLSTAQGHKRRWIVELLARNGQMDAIEILAKLLGDNNQSPKIRGIAAAGLVLRGTNSFAILHKLAENQTRQTSDLAMSAIARIKTNTNATRKFQ